jgi:anti-sigma B factor antagonist
VTELSRSLEQDVAVIECAGRLDMRAAPRMRAILEESVQDGAVRIVADLAGTSFIDSSGLGALVSGLKTTRQAGGDLRIAAAGDQVRTVLRLTNLDRILRPYDTVAEARHDW